jgi:hypothetical protein
MTTLEEEKANVKSPGNEILPADVKFLKSQGLARPQ